MVRPRSAFVALLAVLVSGAVGGAPAQEREKPETRERREEREQREERCVCIRVPEVRGFAFQFPGELRSRVRLGVQVSAPPDPATDSIGARIEDVLPGSPAEEAGLEDGDIIVSLNGQSLLEPLEGEELDEDQSAPAQRLIALARRLDVGDTVRIVYRRGGDRAEATVIARRVRAPQIEARTLRLRAPQPPRPPGLLWREGEPPFVLEFGGRARVMGVEVAELNRDLGEYFGTDSGVLVTDVEPDSPLPLKPGDVILKVGGRNVQDRDHLRRILRSYGSGETAVLEILRKRQRMTVEGRQAGRK